MKRLVVHAARLIAAYVITYAAITSVLVWVIAAAGETSAKVTASKYYLRSMVTLRPRDEINWLVMWVSIIVAILVTVTWMLFERDRKRPAVS
ncbi:MAG TPA: hypothetical protein VI454_12860 [Verrucomicrobiae bacterium]|jgi:hypothetical protein